MQKELEKNRFNKNKKGISPVIATVLLFVTPKKLRLPQTEIKTWD